MTPDDSLTWLGVLQGLAVAVVGGGSGAAVVWYALVERLRGKFVARDEANPVVRLNDFNGLGQKVEGIRSVAMKAHEMADDAKDQARILQERQDHQTQRITEVLVEPLHKLTEAVDQIRVTLAEYGRDMRSLGRGLDELRGRIEGGRRE